MGRVGRVAGLSSAVRSLQEQPPRPRTLNLARDAALTLARLQGRFVVLITFLVP